MVNNAAALSIIATLLAALMAGAAAYHALMTKRDSKAAFAWLAFSLILPVAGPLIYLIFGINRIKTAAQSTFVSSEPESSPHETKSPLHSELRPRSLVGEAVTGVGLDSCDEISLLENGEVSFPAMLADIESAEKSIYCSTYIFQRDDTGRQFIESFRRAKRRGVDVRVLVDGLGGIAYPPIATFALRKCGISFSYFNPIKLFPPSLHINLRNHRKVLVVDGQVAYTGGQNIGDNHLVNRLNNQKRARDLHFRITGKIVDEFERAFLKDWNSAARIKNPEPFQPGNKTNKAADIWARVIPDGPNDDLDKLTKLLVGVLSTAKERIWIMTPYFLPSLDLEGALVAAELRGVDVKILLPERTNIHLAHWAALHNSRYILERGLKVYLQPAPFIHTKAILIDDDYALIGSANLDPRSLRLNFELVVEVFNKQFARKIEEYFERCLQESILLDEARLKSIPKWQQLRNGIAWLFSPYL